MDDFIIKTSLQIQKPSHVVFESITNFNLLKNYFISEYKGDLDKTKHIIWYFNEFKFGVPIKIKTLIPYSTLIFEWDIKNFKTSVNIMVIPLNLNESLVTITEETIESSNKNFEWLKQNTEGWTFFLACLKAYLEYNINLRKGALHFLKFE
ncbi:MAG: SRPBCC domain-containing protein [Alphaproteobacteria bacterium]|nr:SRPBCC domain-containing protein [Alphaproteobacteria bacterium]